VILSTASMREATILSDVIGIMDNGKLKCFGSHIAFQRKYGKGYHLSIVVQENCKEDFFNLVHEVIPNVELVNQDLTKMQFFCS